MSKGNVATKPFKSALACACLGILLVVLALATPEWTVTEDAVIGLWKLTHDGNTYSWTATGAYEDFFYSTWFQATRGLIVAGFLVAVVGVLINIYVVFKKKNSTAYGTILLTYYLLAFSLVVISVAVYAIQVVQGVDKYGNITTNQEDIVEYIYLSDYGYSQWLAWIGAGMFLPAAGMAFEGSNQMVKYNKLQEYITA